MSSKMVMITYNEAIDNEVMEALQKCGLKNYSKIFGTFGSGRTSGIHLGNDIWPGRNNILYVACQDGQAKELLSCIGVLRRSSIAKEGVKAFAWNLEATT
jgi:hypothetical protein